MNIEEIIQFLKNNANSITTIIGIIVLMNEKWREFVFSKFSYNKKKAEIKKEIDEATDGNLDSLKNRVNSMYEDYLKLYDDNLETKKLYYKSLDRVNYLEIELENHKKVIKSNCIKGCLNYVD